MANDKKQKDELSILFEQAGIIRKPPSTDTEPDVPSPPSSTDDATGLASETAISVDRAIQKAQDSPDMSAESLVMDLARQMNMEYVKLGDFMPDAEMFKMFPKKVVTKYRVLPLTIEDNIVRVAISDPYDLHAQDELAFIADQHGYRLKPVLADQRDLETCIDRFVTGSSTVLRDKMAETIGDLQTDDEEVSEETSMDIGAFAKSIIDLDLDDDEAPIVRLINLVLQQAFKTRASDIHFEPYEDEYRVRFRIDGVLSDVENPPLKLRDAITSRLKIMSKMDLAEKRIPQDGRIQVRMQGRDVDFRVSSLPSIWGESIVMRLLDKSGVLLGLEDVGFLQDNIDLFSRIIRRPNGIILMTGPTGSGKTTTLYAALNVINTVDTKIITVEDPVEYQIDGINQVQVDRSVGLTFASALRAMMRQAPNVILVGEMRDLETAEIGITAALTGHLVFSTLHTNDAPSATTRLIEMGIKPFLVASSLQAVIAQRLVRKICKNCKEPIALEPEIVEALGFNPKDYANTSFYEGRGCDSCQQTGYRGRTAIHEIMVLTDTLRDMILHSESAERIRVKARQEGMRVLREDGWQKVLRGETTHHELTRVTV